MVTDFSGLYRYIYCTFYMKNTFQLTLPTPSQNRIKCLVQFFSFFIPCFVDHLRKVELDIDDVCKKFQDVFRRQTIQGMYRVPVPTTYI